MKKFLLIVLLVILLGAGYFFFQSSRSVQKDTGYNPGYISGKTKMDADSPSPEVSSVVSPTIKDAVTILSTLKQHLSHIDWGKEMPDSLDIAGKTYQGTSIQGTYQSQTGGVTDFGEKDILLQDGWSVDNDFAAGGPNGNAWGYTMDGEGGKQLLYFSYRNVSFTPPPGETKCPCEFQVKVFHAGSF